MSRRVLLYELNEVPWHVVDFYVSQRPASSLARVLQGGLSITTVCEDPEPLQPWRTWPTFHESLYTAGHGSYDLGQDPETFLGDPIWNVADRAGKVVGIFGPMQSWPARPFRNGGFYIPDTFARSPETYPASLERFQSFNLAMTKENTFNPEGNISVGKLAQVGVDLLRLGLGARSGATILRHLIAELRDDRHRAGRSIMQVVPSFDLFWQLQARHEPDLSIFFSNHVAGMMHRYWGDGIPGYTSSKAFKPDPVYARFVLQAMDIFDRQLRGMLLWMQHRPDVLIIIASSMGQFAIDKEDIDETFVLDDPARLSAALGIDAEVGSAMYPRTTLQFRSSDSARDAIARLGSVRTQQGALFNDIRVVGKTISFAIDQSGWGRPRTKLIRYLPGNSIVLEGTIDELGVSIRRRMGGGNTAYHVPEGIFIATGEGVREDARRELVSVLDTAPSILKAIGVPPAASYQGVASIEICKSEQH